VDDISSQAKMVDGIPLRDVRISENNVNYRTLFEIITDSKFNIVKMLTTNFKSRDVLIMKHYFIRDQICSNNFVERYYITTVN